MNYTINKNKPFEVPIIHQTQSEMKNLKSHRLPMTGFVLVLFFAGINTSCQTKSSRKESNEHAKDSVHKEAVEDHHYDQSASATSSGNIMWMPDDKPFDGPLKLVNGDANKLKASIKVGNDGAKTLSLFLSGSPVVLLFDGLFENIGANLQLNTEGFKGKVMILYHYTNESNYDYLSLSNTSMQLGRIENGKDNVLDKKDEKMPINWAKLTVSAADEHYKGSLNDKLVNHGHGETRPAGQVGLLLEGRGKVILKMMEVMKLTE